VKDLIYLASPYSTPKGSSKMTMIMRYQQALWATEHLIKNGYMVISPIVHCHYMILPGDAKTWKEYDYTLLSRCNSVMVLMLEGWRESVGVRQELDWAHDKGMLVKYVRVPGYEIISDCHAKT
jgi:Domain of unknown function (DUF1937)